jgi:UDP-xylose/UDP-N-acetylglucosamine transporter B4
MCRYTLTQVISVLLVTLGVILTTLSASNQDSKPEFHPDAATYNIRTYGMGIAILSLALLLSGLLGMVQDKTYAKYGRPLNASVSQSEMDKSGKQKNTAVSDVPAWQESMFYLHFLALPMFISVRHDLLEQFRSVSAGSRIYISIPHVIPSSLSSLLCPSTSSTSPLILPLPRMAIPLLLNTVTQLLCVAGVHRLTTRVSSLTVTLVLVVRKAVSFVLSVLWLRGRGGGATLAMMWIGAALVMLGTVGYALGRGVVVKEGKDKDE